MKDNLKKYTLDELPKVLVEMDLEPYRSQQIFQWLWQKSAIDFPEMTNLSKALRKSLAEHFTINQLIIENRIKSRDGTEKFLFKLEDGNLVESVFIPETRRKTICVSTQVGCPLGCKFCATAQLGFKRNLQAYEIAAEVQTVQNKIGAKVSNVVFMGMGEPLLNLSEIEKAINIMSSPVGLSISQRHITVSTIGLVNGMKHLLQSPLKVKLAISLNFPDEEMRKEMMPATRKNPLKEILKLAREYSLNKQLVTFEYVIIDGQNDRIKDAQLLLKLLKGIPSKINLIPYNPHPLLPFKSPGLDKLEKIQKILMTSRHAITIRKSRGQEILAGCGQLAAETLIV